MKKNQLFIRTATILIVVATFSMAAVGFFVVRSDIDQMRDAGRENILWDQVQVEIELMRFERVLADFSAANPSVSPGMVNDRFDILWSRVSLFQQGTVGARLRAYDPGGTVFSGLFSTIRKVEPLVVGLKAGDRQTASKLLKEFSPFAKKLRSLSRDVLHGEEAKHAVLRENLSQSSGLLTVISVIAVLTSLLMILVFAKESRQFKTLADMNASLLEESDKASHAKSQFLAMMSHELRTPMNGVLGVLSLVRQQGLSLHQSRLLTQAERSGRQMIGLLADILDFSALQDDRLTLEKKPFAPERLAEAVGDMFAPVALREGIDFTASVDATCPARVIGDFARLRQALTHLATYLLETAGTRNIALDISYRDKCLDAAISFDYSKEGGEWTPELIMGAEGENSQSFASEALGPAVSRGLIRKMGGETKLFNPSKNRIAVLISVPAETLEVDVLTIKTACQSAALEAICKAALRGENVTFLDEKSATPPRVVMIEAGGAQEATLARSFGKLYPEAMLVALGQPQNTRLFDDVVDIPIRIETVRRADFMRAGQTRPARTDPRNARYADR